jgi:rhodanese-related sulfurtransferase
MIKSITSKELDSLYRANPRLELIDVRTPIEFREVHVAFARNEPLDRLDPFAIQAKRIETAGDALYFICRSGSRGKQACEKFVSAGIANVVNVEGGTMACDEAGLNCIRGKKGMALERQVRIAAGSFVLLGCVLSLVHPYWIALSAFIGGGLMFSGITDTCGMGKVLARMPWNQVSSNACER